ncbi:MerR family transcriptional regulator [Salsipaludibacter albus]|uniref:MerR family transcriptional regulator n=1 Tax=Salsipaludibacter albus TaxID=2849650 RepID=UPI001EE4177B|nr:MerR family transcriptional regulator [Salsipaludibacter albus]MBY5162730.1 MerR family transcriptional regulator [Salsipaludibacter albus]
MDDLVPIGRFAATSRLSITALRHYHDLGLLVPAVIDPASGYRYYRLGQANRAEAIRTLRSLDVPLDEVAAVLDGDDEQAEDLLRRHQQRLSDALARHERMLGYVRRLVSGEDQLMPHTIDTAQLPAQPVASVRRTTDLAHIGEFIGEAFATAAGAVTMAGAPIVGAPFILYHDLIDEDTSGDIEVCVPVADTDLDLGDDVEVQTLPAATTVRTVHRGPYDQVGPAYHALFAWIHEHDRDQAGPPRETYLNDPEEVAVEDQLTRVDIPIATG